MNPSFSEHGYPHASPPVTEPAQGTSRAIRGEPPTKFVRATNHAANPPRSKAAKMRKIKLTNICANEESTRKRTISDAEGAGTTKIVTLTE